MGARLEDLLRKGVTQIATFVPWQVFETDITHSLLRFLQAATERSMKVTLIVTPEVGVHTAYSGLPKDLLKDHSALAQDQSEFVLNLPPQAFALPSLCAPEVSKRYYSFLSRFNVFLADLKRTLEGRSPSAELLVTGSLWKYYRSAKFSATSPFSGPSGDRSRSAAVSYRQKMDEYYSQPETRAEFSEGAAGIQKWRTQAFDSVNAQWFHQLAEDQFRARSAELIGRNVLSLPVKQVELYTPEADPAYAYTGLFQMLTSGRADFSTLVRLLDALSSRSTVFSGGEIPPWVHWTSLGAHLSLTDAERQFLMLKSLLLFGGRSGGILLEDREWFGFSQTFRSRVERLALALRERRIRSRAKGFYLGPHVWGAGAALWSEISAALGTSARYAAATDAVQEHSKFVVVDPAFMLTRASVDRILRHAKEGMLCVLPRSQFYTESAKRLLERAQSMDSRPVEMSLGISYRLSRYGTGRILVYEMAEKASHESIREFISAVLSLADIEEVCKLSDSRLSAIPMSIAGPVLKTGLFVMNPSGRSVAADLLFPEDVQISDLAASLRAMDEEKGSGATAKEANAAQELGRRFSLEVPPCGVLPLALRTEAQPPSEGATPEWN